MGNQQKLGYRCNVPPCETDGVQYPLDEAGAITSEQRKILLAVALAYRRVMRAPSPCALTRTDAARLAEERQKEAVAAAIAEYRRSSPLATC